MKKVLTIIGIVLGAGIAMWLLGSLLLIGGLYFISKSAKVEINTDIAKYQDYIGENAQEEYKNKWGMDESIFPEKITTDMNVEDYKMVYYNTLLIPN